MHFRLHNNTLPREGNFIGVIKGFLENLKELQGSTGGESHENDVKNDKLKNILGGQNESP